MKGYKEPSLPDRQKAALERKKGALQKFQKHTSDPLLAERLKERAAGQVERSTLRDGAKAERAKTDARDADLAKQAAVAAAEKAARDLAQQRATEMADHAERKATLDAEDANRKAAQIADEAKRKAARDARYAARKARGRR